MTASIALLLLAFLGYLAVGFGIFHCIYHEHNNHLARWRSLLWVAFAAHSFALVVYSVETGQLPIHRLRETFAPLAWLVMALYLVLGQRWKIEVIGAVAAPAASAMTIFAAFALWQDKTPGGADPGLYLHILSLVIGFASLFLAAFCALLYTIQENLLKRKRLDGIYRSLPPLGTLDKVAYRLIWAGFPALVIGIASGVYIEDGRWSWGVQEVVVVATSIVYTLYLHARVAGFQGRRLNVVLLMTSLIAAISFFLPSGHQ